MDARSPAQALLFSLPQAPAGADINEASGVVTWRPALAQAGQSNLFTVVVRQQGGGQTTLVPVADAHVIESYPNANYGSQPNLMVKLSAAPGLTRESFLRFDLSSVPGAVSEATLRLMHTVASSPGTHALALVTNNAWGEMTLTWANKPSSSSVLATWVPQEGVETPVPVTTAAQDARLQDGLLSLRLYATNSTADGLVYYGSKEGAAQSAPQLIVTTSSPSLSATQSFWVMVNAPVSPSLNLAGMGASGHFNMMVSGNAGPDYTIQTSTNLLDWTTVLETNQPALPFQFTDPAPANSPARFYRALLGP